MRRVDVEWWVVAPSVERWCRVMRCNAEWWCRVTSCNAVWWCRVVMPCGSEFSKVVVSTLQFTWLMKIRCTDRELPTVEDRCERRDLTPVQYSNRCVLGTVRASHKKRISRWWSERGTAKAEHRPRLSIIWGPDPLRVVRHFYTLKISQGCCVMRIIFSFCSLFS